MTPKSLSISAALVATMFAAAPAMAQQREHRGEQGRRPQPETRAESGRGERAQPRQEAPAPQPREMAPAAQPRRMPPAPQPRQMAPAPQAVPPPASRVEPRAIPRSGGAAPSIQQPRVDPRAGVRGDRGEVFGPRAVPRVGPRVERPIIVAPQYGYYRPWYGVSRPWYGYRGYDPFRPYYFRPWYRFNFNVFVGYPVTYYAYPYPVPVYGYGAPYSAVYVGPNTQYGGVALEIRPDDAYVYVDGGYAGIVRDFDGSRQPLTLTPGTHHIQIDQTGFESLIFDVAITPGQVIPYQGDMRPY